MKLYYYYDLKNKEKLNSAGKDYTPAYIPRLFDNMGLTANAIGPNEISNGVLASNDAVVIGAEQIDASVLEKIKKIGCTAVLLGTCLDTTRAVYLANNKYGVCGYLTFDDLKLPLPVFGKINTSVGGKTIATIKAKDGREYVGAEKLGEKIFWFCFDLAGGLLYAGDGKPTFDPIPPFPLGRVPDSGILESDYDYTIAFADIYTDFVRNILQSVGVPYVFELPENDGAPADLVLYFAGDDDAASAENDMRASDAMYERGLPYHLNLMPKPDGTFVIDKAQFEELHRRGHETAIHYDFTVFPYSREGHKMQAEMYENTFGEQSVSPVNHCLVQVGTAAERYRWQAEFGARSDNNRFQYKPDPNDINAFNLTGFASGTAFPRFVMDDPAHQNAPIEFCEVYNSYYEPRIYEGKDEEYEKIRRYLDAGFEYARTLQLFTHPHYISGVGIDATPALRAIDFALGYVKLSEKNVKFSAPEAVGEWWHQRAACQIENVTEKGFCVDNPTDRTVYVVLPDGKQTADTVAKRVGGKRLNLVAAAPGKTKIQYK